MRREAIKFWDLVRLILETLRYWYIVIPLMIRNEQLMLSTAEDNNGSMEHVCVEPNTYSHEVHVPSIAVGITMTSWWGWWRLKSAASWLFTQLFIQAHMKENIKALSLAFVLGIHRSPVNSPHKWPVTLKIFHSMTSSWDCVFIHRVIADQIN